MKNKGAAHPASASDIEKLVKEVEAFASRVKKYTVTLTADERRRLMRFRPGGEKLIGLVTELSQKHHASVPGACVDDMRTDLEAAQRLQPLADALRAIADRVEDTINESQAECWWTAMAFYTALARMAETDPQLDQDLGPATDFFTMGRRTRKTTPITDDDAA
jgi:hypothetical protein